MSWTAEQMRNFVDIADAESYRETSRILTDHDSIHSLGARADRAAAALAAHIYRTEPMRTELDGPADYEAAVGRFTSMLDLLTAQPLHVEDVVDEPEPIMPEDAETTATMAAVDPDVYRSLDDPASRDEADQETSSP